MCLSTQIKSDIFVMQSAEDWAAQGIPPALSTVRGRGESLSKGQVRARLVKEFI